MKQAKPREKEATPELQQQQKEEEEQLTEESSEVNKIRNTIKI